MGSRDRHYIGNLELHMTAARPGGRASAIVVFGWRAPLERVWVSIRRALEACAALQDYAMLDIPSPPTTGADYAIVKRAIEFITKRYRDQPSIEAIADHVGLSASHFQHVFKRWAGLTPKAFLQAITIERARELLRDSASVLDAAYDVGLSGPSRLHDLFVAHEALTPGDYRRDDLSPRLWLPSLALRRGDRGRDAARHGRPWLRRRRESRGGARRHGAALAARAPGRETSA